MAWPGQNGIFILKSTRGLSVPDVSPCNYFWQLSTVFLRFFLMYLINKDETEYTGQETYVWDMYQQRCWDFFPAGDCFRKQYESELEGAAGGGGGG